MDGTLSSTSTITTGPRGPGSNSNEEILHIPQISNIGASPLDKF